jgi:hypothetical protein
MKRTILGVSVLLAISALTLSTPTPGGAASKSHTQTATVRCERVAKGHAKVVAADISACKASTVKSGGHCQSGSRVLIVRVDKNDYALRNGHTPFSLGNQPGMGVYSQACGHLAAGSKAGKPSPPAAQVALVGDLVAINAADKNAAASLTTAQADEATGSVTYTQAQVLATVAPVTNAITTALRDLTALIPSVPANMTSVAQALSSALSDALEMYQVAAQSNQPEVGLPDVAGINAADVKVLTSELQIDVTDEGGLIAGADRNYVLTLEDNYSVS